ncbi:hypothetical protein BASA83_002329 [Batrachochytrium salamandrivorans]|nr:hypothetical protein BASA83_002329 [Batrachochytrium salamandrivorans]
MSALALPTDAPRNTSSAGRWSWWGRGATSSLASASAPLLPLAHILLEKSTGMLKVCGLTSTQLKSLNLKQGINTITFKVNSNCKAKRSAHPTCSYGIKMTSFLYLTSRCYWAGKLYSRLFENVEQDRFQLPEGPVIMSPDRLLRAFHRERLFGESCPFYGGFGNRITDALSYRSVDVPQSRIFTIDPTGEIKLELMSNYKSSYIKLLDIVDQMFPPLSRSLLNRVYGLGDSWRNELPEVKIDFSGASAPLKLIKHDSFDDITTDDVSDDGEGYEESNGEGSVQDDAHDYAMKEDVFEHADDSISGERGVGEVSNKKKPQRSLRSIYSQINKTSTKACSAVANQSASCIKDPHCPSQFTWDQVRASSGATAASVKEVANSDTTTSTTTTTGTTTSTTSNKSSLPHTPAYIVIKNKVYDIGGSFSSWHPGGNVALSQVGYDASGAFEAFHGPKAAALLIKYHVGNLAPSEIIQPTAFLKEVHKLRTTIKQKGWEKASPLFYAWKLVTNFSILATSLFLLALYSRNFVALVVSSSLLALFWQQSGWLAHDFLHHQVFKTRAYNNAMGYFIGNVCQGFSVAW